MKKRASKPIATEFSNNLQSTSLGRGMAILEFLGANRHRATLSQLTERLGYPQASVFRVTKSLVQMGYLSRDPVTKQFSLTNKMMLVGQPQGTDLGLVEASHGAIRGLHRATRETVQLCCLLGTENVVLEQLIGSHPFKYAADLGARCPCYSCAPGKAMVAALPEEDREELIRHIKFKRFTETTITSRSNFLKEIQSIVECGYALDRAEGMEGIHCVAAAIRDRAGYPVGALTVAGPMSRIPESDFERLGKMLIEATNKATTIFCG